MVQERFLGLKEFARAKRIALYVSFKNEVLTETIWEEALAGGKEVYFPRIVRGKRGLVFVQAGGKEDFTRGSYDISEPAGDSVVGCISHLDMIVVPGVVFDRCGNRVGYGKGYYDRALGAKRCLTVGLAFEFQLLDFMDSEPHDMKMNKIVTEGNVIDLV